MVREKVARYVSRRKCKAIGNRIAHQQTRVSEARKTMLYTIALILIILWLLGMVTSYTIGGLIHILLVLAIVAILVRVIQGRPAL